ncbi:MAG: hypothetical protein LBL16_04490 [Endomicrobium sp.]|jgi:carboxyl-terminal processing protease|nr:hypothetical protein [Endomicrobium sp.]
MNILKKLSYFILSLFFLNLQAYAAGDEAYEKLKLMIDIMEVINTNYVSEINTTDLTVGAIRGLVSVLDPFSHYMEEKAYKDMKNETEGAYSGVGLRITSKITI